MANTTFNGPVRSENGFQNIVKSSTTGGVTSTMTLQTIRLLLAVANGATTNASHRKLVSPQTLSRWA